MSVQYPAIASSMELSTTSYTRWCSPLVPVSPMYIAGRLRTASRPLSTWMPSAVYSFAPLAAFSAASAMASDSLVPPAAASAALFSLSLICPGHASCRAGPRVCCHPGATAAR